MDRAMIIGVYEFIGFHLSQYLLDQGIEVIGIHIPTDESDPFLEEKRMSIGRNANFNEKDANQSLIVTSHPRTDIVFIDYYSFYMKWQEDKLVSVTEKLIWLQDNDSVIFLMPIQSYEDVKRFNHNAAFYLPAIYGPWQPSDFLFHQALVDPEATIKINEREWTEDALYIDDTIKAIIKNTEQRTQHVLLKSNIKEHWRTIMRMLMKNSQLQLSHQQIPIGTKLTILEVDATDPKEGVERQKLHLDQMSR